MSDTCEVGILFADIAGSTQIYELLGDEHAHAIVKHCLALAGEAISAHNGVVVKTIGDELMAAFEQPFLAFSAAVQIHQLLDEVKPMEIGDATLRLAVRIGFHFGSAVREHADFFGDTVNIAARVTGLAKARQTLTTGEVMELLPPTQRAMVNEFGRIYVKGRSDPVRVARVEWEAKQQDRTVISFGSTAEAAEKPLTLCLVFEGRKWRVPPGKRTISMGREASNDLILKGTQASRVHATIEKRHSKFFLIDHSSNGTNLQMETHVPVKLHREEYGLPSHGHITFGSSDDESSDNLWFYIS